MKKTTKARKIIQLCAQAAENPAFTYMTVLCDDGTVWDICCRNSKGTECAYGAAEWKQLPLVPQDVEVNP